MIKYIFIGLIVLLSFAPVYAKDPKDSKCKVALVSSFVDKVNSYPNHSKRLKSIVVDSLSRRFSEFGFNNDTKPAELVQMIHENYIRMDKVYGLGKKGLEFINKILVDEQLSTKRTPAEKSIESEIMSQTDYSYNLRRRTSNTIFGYLNKRDLKRDITLLEFADFVKENNIRLLSISGLGPKGVEFINKILADEQLSANGASAENSIEAKIMSQTDYSHNLRRRTLNTIVDSLREISITRNSTPSEFVDLIEGNDIMLSRIPDLGKRGIELINRVLADEQLSLEQAIPETWISMEIFSASYIPSISIKVINTLVYEFEKIGFSKSMTRSEFVRMIFENDIIVDNIPNLDYFEKELINKILANEQSSQNKLFEKAMSRNKY